MLPNPDGQWPESRPDVVESESPADILYLGSGHRGWLIEEWTDRLADLPRTVRWSLGAVAGVTALATYLMSRSDGRDPLTPSASGRSPWLATDRSLAVIAATARDPAPPMARIAPRSAHASCRVLPAGAATRTRIMRAVRQALPTYTARDDARSIDASSATCRLALRAQDASGSTVVVELVPASRRSVTTFDHLVVASQLRGNTVVSMVSTRTRSGWTVTVGAVGSLSDVPSSPDMVEIAESSSLLW